MHHGLVAELADAPDLGSGVRKDVRVRIPSSLRECVSAEKVRKPLDRQTMRLYYVQHDISNVLQADRVEQFDPSLWAVWGELDLVSP